MLDIFTVSFFGHRIVENFSLIESQVEKIIMDLLSEKEYVEFLVGRNGEFDQIVSSSIRRAKKNYRDDNCCHNLILPYETAIYHNNYDYFNNYYDQVDIFKKSNSHFKAAIQERNKEMVNRSDLVVFYIENEYGGAYQTYKYALKQNKNILTLPLSV